MSDVCGHEKENRSAKKLLSGIFGRNEDGGKPAKSQLPEFW